MSAQNIEAAKRFIAAFNRRDVEAMVAEVDPEVEWRPASAVALGGEASAYRGHAGMSEGLRDLHESYTEARIELTDYRAVADRVAATGTILVRGKESGAEAVSPFGAVFVFEHAKAIRIRSYLDPAEALAAVGLRE